jgi:6-phosphogluconolactonase
MQKRSPIDRQFVSGGRALFCRRRPVCDRAAILCLTLLVSLAAVLVAAPTAAFAKSFILYAGSYTAGASKGVYAWRFDSGSGAMQPIGLVAATPQPAHIWIAPNGKSLYAVNWEREGGVSAFRIDPRTARLTLLNRVSSQGAQPNQIVLDPSGRIAVAVNFGTGNLGAYKVAPNGSLSAAFYTDQHSGAPLPGGQAGPRAHGIEFTKDGRFMFVAQLGLDRLYTYRVDAAAGTITPSNPAYVSTHGGAGPRRLQLSRDDRFLYVNHETDSEVSVYAVDQGKLTEIQTIPTLPPGITVRNTTSEIIIDPTGQHLYVGNRGHDSIAAYSIDRASGRLTLIANTPAGGRTPRNLRLDPTGAFLLSSNETSDTITALKVDAKSGALSPTNISVPISTPGGLYFLKADAPDALRAGQTVWSLDNPKRIGGFATQVQGAPKTVTTPMGKGLQFDGKQDSVFVDGRPLVGAATFTIEAIIRPEGGAFQQRFLHIAETDPVTGLDADPTGTGGAHARFMFEVRVKDGQWALDAFVNSKGGSKALLFMDKMHPLNRWYSVTQTYDGKTYRAYVDGVLEGEGEVAFIPHGAGHVRIGARMNKVDYFQGSIARLRFSDRALTPGEFLKVPNQ